MGAGLTRTQAPADVPAAVSSLAAPLLAADPRPGRVLAAFPTALYVALERHDQVLTVLTRDALQLPTGLRVASTSRDLSWGVSAGEQVRVGAGRVDLPTTSVVAVREWRPARVDVPIHADPPSPGRDRWEGARELLVEAVAEGRLRALGADLARAVVAGAPEDDQHRALLGLVGAGRGLTPSGDDAVCGVLLALRGAGERLAPTCRALDRALPRTTSLSASLLAAAAQGYAVPEVTRLVRALVSGDERSAATHLPAVLAIGHSSGADLVAGVLGALDALAAASGSAPLTVSRAVPAPGCVPGSPAGSVPGSWTGSPGPPSATLTISPSSPRPAALRALSRPDVPTEGARRG